MQIFLLLAYATKDAGRRSKFNLLAERAMVQGYELIGKSVLTSPGPKLMERLVKRIPIQKIKIKKISQAKLYLSALKPLLKAGRFWLPQMNKSDLGELRGFPLIMNIDIADNFLQHMRNSGILVRFELDDSEWSNRQKMIYLPMGLHLNKKDIGDIIDVLKVFNSSLHLNISNY